MCISSNCKISFSVENQRRKFYWRQHCYFYDLFFFMKKRKQNPNHPPPTKDFHFDFSFSSLLKERLKKINEKEKEQWVVKTTLWAKGEEKRREWGGCEEVKNPCWLNMETVDVAKRKTKIKIILMTMKIFVRLSSTQHKFLLSFCECVCLRIMKSKLHQPYHCSTPHHPIIPSSEPLERFFFYVLLKILNKKVL